MSQVLNLFVGTIVNSSIEASTEVESRRREANEWALSKRHKKRIGKTLESVEEILDGEQTQPGNPITRTQHVNPTFEESASEKSQTRRQASKGDSSLTRRLSDDMQLQ